MPSDLVDVVQDDFGAGIYRGREAPRNAVFDAVNALIDDEGQMFRRGGSVFKSNANVGASLNFLADRQLYGAQRTFFGSAAAGFFALGADDATPVLLGVAPDPWSRAVGVGGLAAMRGANLVSFYGGSLKPQYMTGAVTVTKGSKTVTGVGTSWLANADKGMFLQVQVALKAGQVASVDSNTQITLRDPWPHATQAGVAYFLFPLASTASPSGQGIAALASAGRRLLVVSENRVYFSAPDDPWALVATDYHEMPDNGLGIGAEGVGTTALIFTTAGMQAISNLEFDVFDGVGNLQHTVEQVNELILWGDSGIVGWRGAVVAPCVDDVWLVTLDGAPVPVSGGVKPLYVDYVKQGYQLGIAAVHRGHYVLPVLNGSALVDVLVCRLDRPYGIGRSGQGFPWTRWSGHGAGVAYAQRVGSSSRQPKLLGLKAARVTDLTGCFAPSAANKLEADATSPDWDVTLRDIATGPGTRRHTTRMVQVTAEVIDAATDNPTLAGSIAEGLEGAPFTGLGAAMPESDGTKPHTWLTAKMANRVRVRLIAAGPTASLILRRVGLKVRLDRRP